MTIYFLNTPIIKEIGTFKHDGPIDATEVKDIIKNGFISAIGHQDTSAHLTKLLGVEIPFNRIKITMKVGDIAVVFNLLERMPEGVILNAEDLKNLKFIFTKLTMTS